MPLKHILTAIAVTGSMIASAAIIPGGRMTAHAQQSGGVQRGPDVNAAVHHDVSPALRDIPSKARPLKRVEKPFRPIPTGPNTATAPDGALQAGAGPLVAA